MPRHKTIAQRLQYLIDLKNISGPEAAALCGVHKSQISKMLNGETKNPRPSTIEKIAEGFSCNVLWFRTGDGDPFIPEEKSAATADDIAGEIDQALHKAKAQATKEGIETAHRGKHPSMSDLPEKFRLKIMREIEEEFKLQEQEKRLDEPLSNVGIKHQDSKIVDLKQIPLLGRVPAGISESISNEYIEEYITLPNAPPNCFALIVSGPSMEPEIRDGDYVLFVIDQDYKHNDIVVVNDEFGDSMIKRLKVKDDEYYLVSDNPKYPTYKPNGDYRIMGKVVGAWRSLKLT